jgi:hypothetical protein
MEAAGGERFFGQDANQFAHGVVPRAARLIAFGIIAA